MPEARGPLLGGPFELCPPHCYATDCMAKLINSYLFLYSTIRWAVLCTATCVLNRLITQNGKP